MKILLVYLAGINIISFLMMGIDKYKAKNEKYRISEKSLLISAFIGGSFGALTGMYVFRHKTQKKKFTITIPLFMIIHTVLIFVLTTHISRSHP
ncbi:MAG: DUF1294 domain-containing protein [Anaerofustis stercorihominis]|nr:DUF1294 domain-containing protein [Anaerofustis stercorihominis]